METALPPQSNFSEEDNTLINQSIRRTRIKGCGGVFVPFVILPLIIIAIVLLMNWTRFGEWFTTTPRLIDGVDVNRISQGAVIMNLILNFFTAISIIFFVLGLIIAVIIYLRSNRENTIDRISRPEIQNLSIEQKLFIQDISFLAYLGGPVWPLVSELWLFAGIMGLPIIIIVAQLVATINNMQDISQKVQSIVFLVEIALLIVSIYLLLNGRFIAWKQKKWDSFEAYKQRQDIAVFCVMGWFAFLITLTVLYYIYFWPIINRMS